MAKVGPLKPADRVAYEPVMIAVSKARAMAWTLEQLGAPDGCNNLVHALEDTTHPEETQDWLHSVGAETLCKSLDEIEREYRKLGTNLLEKEAAALANPKDGA
jgi:hypothetical protein